MPRPRHLLAAVLAGSALAAVCAHPAAADAPAAAPPAAEPAAERPAAPSPAQALRAAVAGEPTAAPTARRPSHPVSARAPRASATGTRTSEVFFEGDDEVLEGGPVDVQVYVVTGGCCSEYSSTPTGTLHLDDLAPDGTTVPVEDVTLGPTDVPGIAVVDVQLPGGLAAQHDLLATYAGDEVFAAGPPTTGGVVFLSRTDADLRYLQRLYADLLGRFPDDDGLAYWRSVLRSGGTPADAAWSFARSAELVDLEIELAFAEVLGYAPSEYDRSDYRSCFASGRCTVLSMESDLAYRARWYATARDPGPWVDLLYRNVLRREPDAEGRAYWVDQATYRGRGTPATDPGAIARAFVYSLERQGLVADDLYGQVLRRDADAGGRAYWARTLVAGYPRELVRYSMAVSPEYRTAFTPSGR